MLTPTLEALINEAEVIPGINRHTLTPAGSAGSPPKAATWAHAIAPGQLLTCSVWNE